MDCQKKEGSLSHLKILEKRSELRHIQEYILQIDELNDGKLGSDWVLDVTSGEKSDNLGFIRFIGGV